MQGELGFKGLVGRHAGALAVAVTLAAAWTSTGPMADAAAACPNESARSGASAPLPDCRAYELVTPPNTGGFYPMERTLSSPGQYFALFAISRDGRSVVFQTQGGMMPGFPGSGSDDRYRAVRGDDGWTSELFGPTASQSETPGPGGVSPEHAFAFVSTRQSGLPDNGSLNLEAGVGPNESSTWVRYPDGSFELVGAGVLADDPRACGDFIAPGGAHIVFDTLECSGLGVAGPQLLPDAPPSGVQAVYDRTPDGLHTVSLLPGEVTPATDSRFQGASADGSTVLFSNSASGANPSTIGAGVSLYARLDNAETVEVAKGSAVPAGSTLTCTAGPASAATRNFQWLRNGQPIPGASAATYETTPADAGAPVQCQVFALNANAGSTQVSPPVLVAPAPAVNPPAPPGTIPPPTPAAPVAGTVETCATGTWQGAPTFAYQWYVNGVAVPGATASTYEVQAADVPGAIQCAVTGTNAGGSVTKVSNIRTTSPASSPAAPNATASIANPAVIPAGASRDGDRVFYLQAGNFFAFDTGSEATTEIAATGDADPVNVAADGSRTYFVSRRQIGGEGAAGQPNLFLWDNASGATSLVATVAEADVSGEPCLSCWTEGPAAPRMSFIRGPGAEASKTTPDGGVLVFASRAQLTSFDNAGHTEIYRYDAATGLIECVSCNPGGVPTTDARLQAFKPFLPIGPPYAYLDVANLTTDGSMVFFESAEPLVARDTNGAFDVYRWKDGDVSLITSGHSPTDNYLYGVTPDGADVIFATNETLLPRDRTGGSGSIYDARVGGGFAEETLPGCEGDACQGQPSAPAAMPPPSSMGFNGRGNVGPRRRCAALARKARRAPRGTERARRARAKAKRCRNRNRNGNGNGRAGK